MRRIRSRYRRQDQHRRRPVRRAAGDQNLYAIYTEISRDHDAITVNQTGAWNADGTFCPNCTTTSCTRPTRIPCRASVRAETAPGPQPAGRPALCLHYRSGFGHRVHLALQRCELLRHLDASLPPDNVSKTLTSGPNYKPGCLLENGTYLSYVAPSGVTAHSNNLGTDAAIAGTAGASRLRRTPRWPTPIRSATATTRWPNGIPATGGPCASLPATRRSGRRPG